jgi:hypothetical protein
MLPGRYTAPTRRYERRGVTIGRKRQWRATALHEKANRRFLVIVLFFPAGME